MTGNKARRLSVVRTSSDICLGEGESGYVSVDVHKASYHVAVYSAQRG